MGQEKNCDRAKTDKLLSIREASDYFQIGPYTLYYLAKAGKIPAKLVDNAWRFKKKDICIWIAGSPYDRRIQKDPKQCDVISLSHDKRCGKFRGT